jgi:hypothetical protein
VWQSVALCKRAISLSITHKIAFYLRVL